MIISLVITAFLFALVALIIACLSLSIIVGLKNSTHKIEWKTTEIPGEPAESYDNSTFGSENDEEMFVNHNKRRKKEPPFVPFKEDKNDEEEPFFDEDDPNNTAHEMLG